MELARIILPIQPDLQRFEEKFLQSLETNVELLNAVVRYVAAHKGKRLRPGLLFLVARLIGNLDENGIEAAQIIELIHTATLIHDDVVDQSDLRRSVASVHSVWNNKIAVLVGDFLFAQALNKMMNLDCSEINKVLAKVTTRMSEGELLQVQQSQNLQTDEQGYFQMISDKTASLISASCQIGAIVGSNYDGLDTNRFWDFGNYLGCAFQIQDDLLDYIGDEDITGKPARNDLKQNKITLPLIYAINKNGKINSSKIRDFIEKNKAEKDLDSIIELVIDSGGVDYARERANDLIDKALSILAPFPDNEYKRSLEDIVQFVAVRSS